MILLQQELKRDKGVYARIGSFFHARLELIKNERLKLGIDKKRKSTRALTNLILKHNSWVNIQKDIINLGFKELGKNEQ